MKVRVEERAKAGDDLGDDLMASYTAPAMRPAAYAAPPSLANDGGRTGELLRE